MDRVFQELMTGVSVWTPARMERLQGCAIEGRLRGSPWRALAWRLFLNVLPTSDPPIDWRDIIALKREQYSKYKHDYFPDFSKVSSSATADPLQSSEGEDGGGWARYYADLELVEEIKKDLVRLYPDGVDEQRFHNDRIQGIMLGVLFVWSTLHKETSYRQGMHEVLAVLVYALEAEAEAVRGMTEGSPSDTLSYLLDPDYLEHDAFILFEKIMMELEPLYMVNNAMREDAPILKLSHRIQGELLEALDQEVHRNLHRLEVTPQFYVLKWARLLFAREFVMEDVLALWDYMLASRSRSNNDMNIQTCIEVIGVAMIRTIRSQLLADDMSQTLRQLMSYPRTVSVRDVVAMSVETAKNRRTLDMSSSARPLPPACQASTLQPSQPAPSWLRGLGGPPGTVSASGIGRKVAAVATDVVDRAQQSLGGLAGPVGLPTFLKPPWAQPQRSAEQLNGTSEPRRALGVVENKLMPLLYDHNTADVFVNPQPYDRHVPISQLPSMEVTIGSELEAVLQELTGHLKVALGPGHSQIWSCMLQLQSIADAINGRSDAVYVDAPFTTSDTASAAPDYPVADPVRDPPPSHVSPSDVESAARVVDVDVDLDISGNGVHTRPHGDSGQQAISMGQQPSPMEARRVPTPYPTDLHADDYDVSDGSLEEEEPVRPANPTPPSPPPVLAASAKKASASSLTELLGGIDDRVDVKTFSVGSGGRFLSHRTSSHEPENSLLKELFS